MRPIGVVEAHEPVEFGGQLRILDRVPEWQKKKKHQAYQVDFLTIKETR